MILRRKKQTNKPKNLNDCLWRILGNQYFENQYIKEEKSSTFHDFINYNLG